MSSNIFRISAVAATIAASFGANAALYNVYLEAPEGTSTAIQTYGVAISPETTVCWSNACDDSTSKMATEVKRYREGFSYRDEAPFFLPFGWNYLDDNYDGFKNYCRDYLRYAETLCENWASAQYTNGYAKEQGGDYAGSIAYYDGSSLYSENTVVNSIDNGFSTGNRSIGGTPRNVAFTSTDGSSVTDLSRTYSGTTYAESHGWKTLKDGSTYYTVGSVSRTANHATSDNNSYAAVWVDGVLQAPISWVGGTNNGDNRAHASARDIVKDGNNLYAVGYNSDGDVRLKATVFKSENNGGTSWTSTLVSGFPYDSSEYANQTLKAVNNNKIAIGTAKLNQALNGAYANMLFYVDNLDVPAYKAFSGNIFFTGANGLAGNINNYNDVVGTIDYEQHSETNGKPRAQRAFIANLGTVTGSAPIGGQARYLDDLTYGSGATTSNNQYRIIQAADINDAGVIAATAYYCAGGFESDAIDAICAAGASLAGVKLVPIAGKTASDISPRPVTQTTVERQGGTLGFLVLTVLGLLGFRRK
ncbi:DUF3466 family protein [Vibrio bivalvicida]|uniref:GlyGly-CTERM sorting domain-containing protein n=1 Tax=Vibrio bivalvicida TaxID=1276888 RepID=A0A177XUK3_9VIBR|nr:DUF3466 family protein [Vibrio bivalvicida]OAJ92288.1 hypothetical protein APB76_20020 [Vibrio bivalvicida]